jgi:transposase-like protein
LKTKHYDQEFKEQIIRECQEVGNAALVARRHDLSKNTVHNWLKATRRNGSVAPLPKNKEQRLKKAERRLQRLSGAPSCDAFWLLLGKDNPFWRYACTYAA